MSFFPHATQKQIFPKNLQSCKPDTFALFKPDTFALLSQQQSGPGDLLATNRPLRAVAETGCLDQLGGMYRS
jgi:hypothetical protein